MPPERDGDATPPGRFHALGMGYVATALAGLLAAEGWEIAGTVRAPEKAHRLAARGWHVLPWSGGRDRAVADALDAALGGATHLLHSIPPETAGDPVLSRFARVLAEAPALRWVGYLSTTGVYGDRRCAWTDETVPPAPLTTRGRRRAAAERAWLDLARRHAVPVHIFRLSGIYGPGRSALDQVAAGNARRIVKPGHVTNRIHLDDILAVLLASIARPNPGAVYNLADDLPAPSADVVAEAARLLGLPPPPETAWDAPDLSPMVRSFYGECRRIDNRRIKRELGVTLTHPTFREGLAAELARRNPAGQADG
ncbi:MAG: SDR family oxidoreductase [Azospirillaceae bacterium]